MSSTIWFTSNTYPFMDGSDVSRSSGFWSLPTLVSSPAWSCQSMVTNVSNYHTEEMSYSILFDYPAQAYGFQVLEEFTEWFVETLYPKLLVIEEAWRKMEEMTAELVDGMVEAQAATACMHVAPEHVTAVMRTQALFLDIVEYPKANDRVKWTLFLDGDVVFEGKAKNKSEVLCASFFEGLRRSLEKLAPCYPLSS